jgi:hypothetical protein
LQGLTVEELYDERYQLRGLIERIGADLKEE